MTEPELLEKSNWLRSDCSDRKTEQVRKLRCFVTPLTALSFIFVSTNFPRKLLFAGNKKVREERGAQHGHCT